MHRAGGRVGQVVRDRIQIDLPAQPAAEGIERLRPFAPTCQTIDVAALIADAAAAREQLIALGPDRMSEFDLANASRVRFAR